MSLSLCAPASVGSAMRRPAARRSSSLVVCSAFPDRRGVMLGLAAGALLVSPLASVQQAAAETAVPTIQKVIPVRALTAFQKADIITELQRRAVAELNNVLTAADAPDAVRLLLHDAATFDKAAGIGGVDGSVVLP